MKTLMLKAIENSPNAAINELTPDEYKQELIFNRWHNKNLIMLIILNISDCKILIKMKKMSGFGLIFKNKFLTDSNSMHIAVTKNMIEKNN